MRASKIRVLLLEDEVADAALVCRQLDRAAESSFEVVHATSIAQARRHIDAKPFDAILADLNLPDCQGAATVARLGDVSPGTPVLVLTGSTDFKTRYDVLALGAQDYVTKDELRSRSLVRAVELAVSRARFQAGILNIVEKNADGCVVVDAKGQILFANQAAAEMFGCAPSELRNEKFRLPFAVDGATVEITGPESRPLIAELRVTEIDWRGRPATLISLRDTTDRERAKELERQLTHADRLASVGQLAAGVAHEVNNPATYIDAGCQTIIEEIDSLTARLCERSPSGDIDVEWATSLQRMRALALEGKEGIGRIITTVRALGMFARIEETHVCLVDLNDVIEFACTVVKNELRHRGEFVRDLAPLPKIAMDRAKMAQVFVNLFINAGHAVEQGVDAPLIRVESKRVGDELHVRVEDNGHGIEGEDLARIFEPFFTTKARDVGTGLGLPISAETVRRHRGTLSVSSTPGVGSSFVLVLPLDTGLTPSSSPPTPTNEPNSGPPSRGRILLIDDDTFVRRALRRVLSTEHDVAEAEGAEQALAMLADDASFDVVLCDMMMPGMDGPSFYERLSTLHPELAPRVVFVTGGAFSERGREFALAHSSRVLEKPVGRSLLMGTIQRVLQAHEA